MMAAFLPWVIPSFNSCRAQEHGIQSRTNSRAIADARRGSEALVAAVGDPESSIRCLEPAPRSRN